MIPVRALGLLLCAVCLACASTANADAGLDQLKVPGELRVVSYYPADAGWTRMWEPWRPERIECRSPAPARAERECRPRRPARNFIGYPVPEERYRERLREFVDIAARNGLRVQVTLFDWWGSYRDIEGSKQWARAMLEPYVGDPRIAFVELRNEIDTTDPDALAWTRVLVPWLRDLLRKPDARDRVGRRE